MPTKDSEAPATILIGSSEEDKKEIAKLKATIDDMEKAKKASDNEKKDLEAKIAGMKKGDVLDEPSTKVKEQDAKIATLQAKVIEPIIIKMLTAKEMTGSSPAELVEERKRLSAMTMEAVESEFNANQKLIATVLNQKIDSNSALIATVEKEFEFNGGQTGLTGKVVSIDSLYRGKSS